MTLFELMSNRWCVNILKVLFDNEIVDKKSYTMKLSEIQQKLGFSEKPSESLLLLQQAKLIELETASDKSDIVLSITKKGRKFIECFSGLKQCYEGIEPKKPVVAHKIEYTLTDLEKRILLLCFKMKKEIGRAVLLKDLTQEVYPVNAESRQSTVSRYVTKLEKLNLMRKIKENNRVSADVTDSGERVVKQQFMEALV